MKELSIEEKAKRYDEAVEKLRSLHDNYDTVSTLIDIKEELDHIFPELKESEDEKIRKEILNFVRGLLECHDKPNAERDERYESWIAWLERQDEQKSIKAHNVCDFCEERYGCVSHCSVKLTEKQNPADKVEPKFHEGEWITNGDYTWHIVSVTYLDYILRSQDGNTVDDTISYVDEHFHSFTIQDAKYGDVLVTKNKNIFIFKSISGCTIYDYCGLYFGKFESSSAAVNGIAAEQLPIDYVPATKEQREFLFQKMKEAGYEWDDEQKQLKKIKQKPAWSEDDKYNHNIILYLLNNECVGGVDKRIAIEWFKSLKDRYTWKPSEEQMKALEIAIRCGIQLGIWEEDALKSLVEQLNKLREE